MAAPRRLIFLLRWFGYLTSFCTTSKSYFLFAYFFTVSFCVFLSDCQFVCPSVCLPSVCLPVCLSACLLICLTFYQSVCLPVCLTARLSVCPSVWLSVRLSVCLSICLYFCLLSRLSVNLSVRRSDSCLFAGLPVGGGRRGRVYRPSDCPSPRLPSLSLLTFVPVFLCMLVWQFVPKILTHETFFYIVLALPFVDNLYKIQSLLTLTLSVIHGDTLTVSEACWIFFQQCIDL